MKNIFKYSPGFLAGVILSSAFAGAAAANSNLITNTIDELWVFVAGDPVLASQVNENFEYLDLKIDEEVSFLSDDVIANTVSILNNEDGVGVNQGAISQVDSSLSSFQSSQSVRDGDQDVLIADNGARITTLENSGSGISSSYSLDDLVLRNWSFRTLDVDTHNGSDILSFSLVNDYWVPSQLSNLCVHSGDVWTWTDLNYNQSHAGLYKTTPMMYADGTIYMRFSNQGGRWFVFLGRMNASKTRVDGEYYYDNWIKGTWQMDVL